MTRKYQFSLLILIGLALLTTFAFLKKHESRSIPRAEESKTKPSMIYPNDEATRISSSPQPIPLPMKTVERESRLHPLVDFENPQSIRSFSDPKLIEAFSIYASLVGDAKRQFPIGGSPFDTEENSEAAARLAAEFDYSSATDQDYIGLFNALLLLTESELASAKTRLWDLTNHLIARISESPDQKTALLIETDLNKLLLKSFSENPNRATQIYYSVQGEPQSALIQASVLNALTRTFETSGLSSDEIRTKLSELQIPSSEAKLIHIADRSHKEKVK